MSRLLSPISRIYENAADKPFGGGINPSLPVLCVGNFVAGGAGKTPLAIGLAKLASSKGKDVAFLTRGYGGSESGPRLVNSSDVSGEVGDEPLLLQQLAPTVVAKNRGDGLAFIEQELKPDLVIMDDGFQSAVIKPTHAMLVVDNARGIGNGMTIPAGPLRARLETQVAYADSFFILRGGAADTPDLPLLAGHMARAGKPIFSGLLMVKIKSEWKGKPVVAFSGIGNPGKFFSSLKGKDVQLAAQISFPDHHQFTAGDAKRLLKIAEKKGAQLLTTAKDAARLNGAEGILGTLRNEVGVVETALIFDELEEMTSLLGGL